MSPYELRALSKVFTTGLENIVKVVYSPTLNHFILLDERNRFFLADGNGEIIFGPIEVVGSSDSSKISIDFNNFHNCLLAWDNRKFNIRRDLAGTWLLKTVLAEKTDTSGNEMVEVELTLNEATKLLHSLVTTIRLNLASEEMLKEVVEDLQAKIENAKETEKSARGHKWASVILRGPYNYLLITLNAALTDLKQSGLRQPILPVISSVVERLNLLKEIPYVIDLNNEASMDKTVMASEAARRLTFGQWPHMDYKWALPDQMAEAGFFHHPNTSGDDRVFCFTCTVCLVCWEPADEPWSEHERHSPACPFVRGEYTQNVPISVVYASSSALMNDLVDEIHCVSKSSHCDWIASSTRYGEIVLWNIAKDLKRCNTIALDPSEPFLEMKTGYRCRPRRHLKSGVAWADETEYLSPATSASPSSIGAEAIRDAFESGNNEIASEIVAVCPQKGDFVVTAICTCGQPSARRPISEIIDTSSRCMPALIVGCGIIESKLRTEQRNAEISSPSSFVENLNTVNKAASVINECILPPSVSSSDDQQSASGSSVPRYRPFILVYKMEEMVSDDNRGMNYADKPRRTGTVPQGIGADKSVLASVKEIDESPHIDDDYDEMDMSMDDKLLLESLPNLNISVEGGSSQGSISGTNLDKSQSLDPLPDESAGGYASATLFDLLCQNPTDNTSTTIQPKEFATITSTNTSAKPGSPIGYSAPTTSMGTATVPQTPYAKKASPANDTSDILIKEEPKPLKASIAILQCLRLPVQLDSALYYVHSIVPLNDGSATLVVVNKHESSGDEATTSSRIISAIILYRMSFSCHVTSLVEQPHRQVYFDSDVGLLDTVFHLQSTGLCEENSSSNLVAVLTKSGDIRVINLDNGATVARNSPPSGKKYTAFCVCHDDKLCATCDDGSIVTLEVLRPDLQMDDSESASQSLVDDTIDRKDSDLVVNKPLTLDTLKELWLLTRSDWATSGQFSMQAPSSWVEVQQHQRLRKNPQHYLREEKLAKSWHLVPDTDTWFEHVFEITLPANFSASHIDFRFALHQAVVAGVLPPIQVTFLRQLPTIGSRSASAARDRTSAVDAASSSASPADAPSTSASTADIEDQSMFKNHVFSNHFLDNLPAEIIAGPYDANSALDLYDLNGLIQFSSPQLNDPKMRTFFIHVQALAKKGPDAGKSKAVELKGGMRKASSAASGLANENKMPAAAVATGLYQQKYGVNKVGAPIAKGGVASNIRVVSRYVTDARKIEDLKGCDWIQEVSVTVWRTKKTTLKKERKQRLAMTRNMDFIANLIKALDGCGLDAKTPLEFDALMSQQYLILDLLMWILYQGTSDNKRVVECLFRCFDERLDNLFRSCYVFPANRSISRKFTAVIADLLMKIKVSNCDASNFLTNLKSVLRRFIFNVDSYRGSGSAVWLLALAEEVYKLSPIGCTGFLVDMQKFACAVGEILKARADMHCNGHVTRYGLLGFPFELELFEMPPPILMLLQRSQQPFTYAAVSSSGTSLIANFCSDYAQDENDWLEIVGIDYSSAGGSPVRMQRRGRMIRLEREHLYGLIEVEPLQFVCYSASDGIKIENVDTGISVVVAGASNSVPTSTGAGPIPIPDVSHYEQSGNPALTSAVTSMKQQVQSILSKQMQLLAIQQQKQKLQVKLTDHVEKLASLAAEQIPATQASSASTFGVPTTPKTTPFMTPTPLSPSHLSPINSEVDLRFDGISEEEERIYGATGGESGPKLVPAEFLKPPPVQALVVDRMSSGARKFVILSFERPVLLTDLIIPQCGDIGSLSIDVWLKSESDDGQRLVVCNDISQKTLVLCDLQPPCLCQYLKITYIGRQGLGSCTSKIPLGCFYGYTFATPSQLVVVDGVAGSSAGRTFEDAKSLRRPALSMDQLRQLEEDVACRYNLACNRLRNVLESVDTSPYIEGIAREKETESLLIREICKEITGIRIQWNLIHRAIERFNVAVGTGRTPSHIPGGSSEIGYDKARVISELLFSSMIRMSPLLKLDMETEIIRPSSADNSSILPLKTAVDIFERFCLSGIPCLTALSVVWLLHHGAYSNWWGSFFGVILDKFFTDEGDAERARKIFLILSYLVDRGLVSGNSAIFLDLLNRLNEQLPEKSLSGSTQRSLQMTLMLLSHGVDNFPYARVLGSRWDFLLGEYSKRRHSSPKGDGDRNNNPNRHGKSGHHIKDVLHQSDELIAQHHQKVMQLSSELKEYVKNKSMKQPTFMMKHKSSTPLPYAHASNSGWDSPPSTTKTGNSRAATEPSPSATARSSPKKARLKLPYGLCLSVVRKLGTLILSTELSCSAETYILMCKVLSVISRCSRPLLHVSDVFNAKSQIHQLIRTMVVSRNVYVHRALICLVQDFLVSEAKCDNARNTGPRGFGNGSGRSVAQPPGSGSSGSLELEASGIGGGPVSTDQTEMAESTEALAQVLVKMAEEKDAAITALSSACAASGDSDFQWGTSSKGMDTSLGAQAYVESWVDTIKPAAVTNSKISYDKRQQRLRDVYREQLYAHAAKFGYEWLQETKGCSHYVIPLVQAEEYLAKTIQSESQYDEEMSKLVSAIIMTGDVLAELDSKAFQNAMDGGLGDETLLAASKAVVNAVSPSMTLPPSSGWEVIATGSGFAAVGSNPMIPPLHTLQQTYYASIAPPPPPPPASGTNLAEAKDALWKLCEHLNASAAKVSSSTLYMSLADVAPPPPPPVLSSSNTVHSTAILDMDPGESIQMSVGDAFNMWDDDSDSEGTPMESEIGPTPAYTGPNPMYMSAAAAALNSSHGAPAHLWKTQENYTGFRKAEFIPMDMSPLENIQPVSLSLDERMESQLGWQAEVAIRRWLLVNNASLRISLQTAASFQKPSTGASFVQQRDQRVNHNHISSAAAISEAFTNLFDSLSSTSSPIYVENLLDSCWLLSIGNDTKTHELPFVATVRAINLGEKAIKKLLSWLLDGVGVSEKIWCLALRILAVSVRQKAGDYAQSSSTPYGIYLMDDPNFPAVIFRLLTKVRAFGSADLAGPAIVQSFYDLLTCIHLHLNNMGRQFVDRFRNMLVQILLDSLNEREFRSMTQLPLDTLNKLIEVLLNQPGVWRIDARLVADFVSKLSLNVTEYLLAIDSTTEALLSNNTANPRFCFIIGKPDLTSNEFRCFHDRLDVVVVNLLKLANKLLNCVDIGKLDVSNTFGSGESMTDDAKAGASAVGNYVSEAVLNFKPSLVESILNAIGLCYCGGASKSDTMDIRDLCNAVPVTVADAVVQLLFMFMNRASGIRLVNFLTVTVNFLNAAHDDLKQIYVSDLSIFVLLWIFDYAAAKNDRAFNESGLVSVLAQQLIRCCQTIDPAPLMEHSQLLKSAAAVCGRGPKAPESTSKKLSEAKVDGMTNFAPLCYIVSSSPMAHHLTALLNSTPPHRRARSAAWSYHFYPAESWLDMTLTLPYTVILKEVQIRPHLGSLQSSPTAVQIELSPDSNTNSFRSIAPPTITAGCTKIRISTENFGSPVRMVRLHFKRPLDSTTLGMSQILLLGHPPLSMELPVVDYRLRWLQLLHHGLKLAPMSFFHPSNSSLCTSLARKMVDLFLSVPLDSIAYGQLIEVFLQLETHSAKAGAESPFKWLLECIGAKDCAYRTSAMVWLPELISRLCSSGATTDRTKITMLSQWTYEALEAYCCGRQISLPILRCIIWTCSCILWQWEPQPIGRRLSIRPEMMKLLYKAARDADDAELRTSCGYMLCSIVRTYPEQLDGLLQLCGFGHLITASNANSSDSREAVNDANGQSNASDPANLRVLAFIAQSGLAVRALESRGILIYLVNTLTSMCIEEKNIRTIIAIVELLNVVSSEPFVKSWISGSEASIFWSPLLTYVCLSRWRTSAPKDDWQRLERGTISLLRNCISCHRQGQRLVSRLLAQLLTEIAGGLNGSIQQVILRVLLEDEKILVATKDAKFIRNEFQLNHPRFGCGINVAIRNMSIYSTCAQLLPDSTRKSTRKKVSYNACCPEFSDTTTFYGGDPALADVAFAGEKAKAKRMTGKSTPGDSKSESGGKNNTSAACPIAFVSHQCFGLQDPLPGKLTLGQLYEKLLAVGEDSGSFHLVIQYGLSSQITAVANEKLLELPAPQSTLEVFARQGGLALLAEHLQLYQPSVGVYSSSGAGLYGEAEWKILDEMQSSANKPFLNDPETMDYYDPSYEWVNVASGGADGFVIETSMPQSKRMRNVVNVGLSPHVVVCFGVFLRVAGYAELLVTRDRRQAQWLLRLAMGVTTDALGVNIVNSSEAGSMGILPFEILSSLCCVSSWSTEEGLLIRTTSLDLGIPQLLLKCLAAFSHQNERRSMPAEEKPEVVRVVDQLLAALANSDQVPGSAPAPTADEKSHLYWAKGTGFGTGSTQQQWNVDLHIIKQKQDEQSVACLLKVLAHFIYPGEINKPIVDSDQASTSKENNAQLDFSALLPRWPQFVRLLSDSCLVPTLQSYLRNDSVLDISRHVSVYESVMRLLCSLALCPQLSFLLTELGDHQESLRSLLAKLKDCVDIYISKLEPLKQAGDSIGSEDALTEEGLLKLVPLIKRTSFFVQRYKPDSDADDTKAKGRRRSGNIPISILSHDELYIKTMKPLQFDSFKFLKEGGNGQIRFALPYHYEASVQGASKDISALAPCVRRLAQEAVTLSTSLPLSYGSSVFVRTAEERLDVMKVLITGPCDTPYANGCFEFDVWFPTDYPNSPMHINLQTTGGSTVRFNPNLYNDGKVCLSILNTWHGRPEERWNAQTSSFLQVLVSIQSLILVSDPYFNEPGYERSRGTPAGQHASREYDANIRQATVRWGMLEMVRNPPACFKEVIHDHFWIKRDEICKQIEGWISELESSSSGGSDKRIQRSLVTHLSSLKRHYSALKDELVKMTRPEGLEDGHGGENSGTVSSGI